MNALGRSTKVVPWTTKSSIHTWRRRSSGATWSITQLEPIRFQIWSPQYIEPLVSLDGQISPKKSSLLLCRYGNLYATRMWFAWIAATGARLCDGTSARVTAWAETNIWSAGGCGEIILWPLPAIRSSGLRSQRNLALVARPRQR